MVRAVGAGLGRPVFESSRPRAARVEIRSAEPGVTVSRSGPRERPPADYPGCPATVTDAESAGRTLLAPRWGLPDVLVGGAIYLALAVAVGVVLLVTEAPLSAQILLGTTIPWIGLAGWPLFATARRGNGLRIDLGLRLTWPDAGWGALAGAAGLMLAGIAALITSLFVEDLNSNAGEIAQELTADSNRITMFMFAVALMVGAPIVEELFFRGLFFAALRKRGLNGLLTVLITAVVFAGIHLEPSRFFVLLPTGIVLGWVRLKTGSTGSSMVAHGLVNAPGAILLLVGLPQVTP